MAYTKAYTRIIWRNDPSTDTPLNETNLNKMDAALNEIDNRVIALQNSAYVYIRYSDYPNPTNLQISTTPADYMGICVTSETSAPITASSYTWQKVVGKDGDYVEMRATDTYIQYKLSSASTWTNLIALSVLKGANGQSAYVWIKWGTSANPATLLDTPADYIGIYSGSSSVAPVTASSYMWYKYKGNKGDTGQGFKVLGYYVTLSALQQSILNPSPGDAYGVGQASPYDIYIYDGTTSNWVNNGALQGAAGQSAYVWIKYATQSPTSDSDMLNTPADWMGIYSGILSSPPTTYTMYEWYKIKGADGARGVAGPNEISTETTSDIEGILKGSENKVAQAVADTDYTSPSTFNTHKNNANIHVTTDEKSSWNNKQPKLTAGENINISEDNVISSTGGGGVFWAVYGSTTSAEIEAAYQAGKDVICKYNGAIYRLSTRVNSTIHTFDTISGDFEYYVMCSSNDWTNGFTNINNYRKTSVNAADTNYTTLMARGEKLLDGTTFDAVTDWTSQLVNGAIAWRYE